MIMSKLDLEKIKKDYFAKFGNWYEAVKKSRLTTAKVGKMKDIFIPKEAERWEWYNKNSKKQGRRDMKEGGSK